MDATYARWNAIENERRAGLPPIMDPTVLPTSATILRIRKEEQARDVINSRAWDNFHATPPTAISSDNLKTNGRPVYYDMSPICSRTNTVQYRIQQQYIPDPPRAATKASDLGNAPPADAVLPPANTMSGNPYTQRLDAGGFDARNTIRELRGAVVEDNREVKTDADRRLIERQFYDRWLPAKVATDASSLEAYELLRPRQGYQN
jgi:hypothetical protein